MAGVKDGFGVTLGVMLAIVIIPLIGMSIFCAGCFSLLGVGSGVVSEAAKQAEATRKRNEEKANAAPVAATVEVANEPQQPQEILPVNEPEPKVVDEKKANPLPEKPADSSPIAPIEPKKDDVKNAGPTDDDKAASQLKLAKSVMRTNEARGKKRLQEIIDKYPDTEAATEAAKLLGK